MPKYEVYNECVDRETGRRLHPPATVSLSTFEGARLMKANCVRPVETATAGPPENAAQPKPQRRTSGKRSKQTTRKRSEG